MPPIIIAFWIALSAAVGPPLVKGLVTPPDPAMRSKFGRPVGDTYRTWTSRPWVAVSDAATRRCEVTYFATTTTRRPVRLLIGDQEQLLDTGWSAARTLREGERRTVAFEFRDPVGGAVLSCQEQSVVCYGANTYTLDTDDVREGRCRPDAPKARRNDEGRPHLIGYAKPFTLSDPGLGGAYVDVTFEITGTVDERWYCPALEVEWPDGTKAKRESDCAPFDQRDPEQRFRWTFNHGFPGGTWKVKACVYKSGATLACADVTVRVLGDESGSPFMGDGR